MICLHPVQSVPPVPWQPGHLVGYTVYSEIWLATPDLQAYDAAHRQRVIAHELGHAMGLQHTGPGTLMYPAANGGAMTVQPTDAAQWRTVHAALGK
jgi:hypothetical protein